MQTPRCPRCSPDGPTRHRQVHLNAAGFCVDAGLSTLLSLLASRGVRTLFSCEEFEPGTAQIGMASAADLEQALLVIAEAYPEVRSRFCDGDGWSVRVWPTLWWRCGEQSRWNDQDGTGPVYFALFLPRAVVAEAFPEQDRAGALPTAVDG